MDDRQNNKLNMAKRTSDVMTKYNDVFAHILPMVDAAEVLKINIGDIRDVAEGQESATVSPATKEKRKVEGRMIDLSVKVANALYVVGFIADNSNLTELQGLSPRSFYQVADNTKISRARSLYKQAQAYAGELQAYGYGDAEIAAIGEAIDAYEVLIAAPRGAIGAHKQKTTNLKQLYAELDSTLYDKLDKLIVLFKDSHPDFYNEYRTARNLIDNGGGGHGGSDAPPSGPDTPPAE